jgi:xanthine dehydrogenase accessory factor
VVAACRAGEPAALVTLVYSEDGAVGTHIGRKILVRFDSSTVGHLGGKLEGSVVEEAHKALQKNHSVRLGYRPRRKKLAALDSFKRQPLEFFVDVVQPRSELVIIGAGHIGLALAEMAQTMDMRVVVVDDRPEWLDRFPDADEAILVPYEPENERLGRIPITVTPSTSVLVATWGWDEPALEQVVGSPAPYIGLVASRRKAKLIFDELLERGVSQEELMHVHVPAGLDIGAETPPEIALSILSEMLLLQRDATGLPMQEVKGHPLALSMQHR